jgi:GNAT superfamily N-acetyltransferase
VIDLSVLAWSPVFASMRQVLGAEIFDRLHPDGISAQAEAVRSTCTDPGMTVVVADDDGRPVGFAAYSADEESRTGVIDMVAVHPDHQGQGIGTALTEHAFTALRAAGMRTAMVETGGDPGHAPARRTYEKAGATLLPIARYFTAL